MYVKGDMNKKKGYPEKRFMLQMLQRITAKSIYQGVKIGQR